MTERDELLHGFHRAMLDVYEGAKRDCGYNATRFLQMVSERGGLDAAKALLASPEISDGFVTLWQHGRLDLSVEAVILKEPWRQLFSTAELTRAEQRLKDANYSA